jgi:hypothetical protein
MTFKGTLVAVIIHQIEGSFSVRVYPSQEQDGDEK